MAAYLTLAIGLMTAWLYTVGWSYASHYFEYFHVGLLALNIPRESFLLYSFWVLRDHPILLAVVLLLAAAMGVWGARGRLPLVATRALIAVTPLLVLVLFWGGYRLGESTARAQFLSDRDADYPAHPRVRVWVDPAWAKDAHLAPLTAQLTEGCYRLLVQNRDTVFLFHPVRQVLPASLPLVEVPTSSIQALRILPRYESCASAMNPKAPAQ